MNKVVSNKRQLAKLVNLMKMNPDIAKGICSKNAARGRLEEFTVELNSLGPPERDWDKWLRVWMDLKCKIKKKKSKMEMAANDVNPNKIYHFSDLEETVVEMMQWDTSINQSGNEIGLEEVNCNDYQIKMEENEIHIMDVLNDESVTEDSERPKFKMPRKDEPNQRLNLLEQQTNAQKHFYENINLHMTDIKTSLKKMEEYTRKMFHQKEEILKLKREKFKLYKKHIESKERDRAGKLNIKTEPE